jgi:hypothetical protein
MNYEIPPEIISEQQSDYLPRLSEREWGEKSAAEPTKRH